MGDTYSDSESYNSNAKEVDSKPSKSDANTSSDLKPCKSDAKELDSNPCKFDTKELHSKLSKSHESDSKEHDTPSEEKVLSIKDQILQKAHVSRKSQTYDDPTIWGVLTAITENAIQVMKYRGCQGHCIYLKMAKHCIGLTLKQTNFPIPNEVVNNDYGIYLTRVDGEEKEHLGSLYPPIFLCDTSAFATYVNWKRLTKGKPVQIGDGDIISLCGAPDDVKACGFAYQLVYRHTPWQEGPDATIRDQLEPVRKEFAEMKKLLCVNERAELKAELRAELKAELRTELQAELKD